jgi:hypothetical protein
VKQRNLINAAVNGQERRGVEQLRDSGRLQYRAVTPQTPTANNSLTDALKNFGQAAASTYGSYKEVKKVQADERSNEIIRKLTPEQRREATRNGTLLYQDDPDAMIAVRFKSGRNAAFEVETEIKAKISAGDFKTSADLTAWRNTRLEQKAQSYAESTGISFDDVDYQRGYNANIVDREAAIYDLHAQHLSNETQAIAQMEAVSDVGSMFSDPGFVASPNGPQDFVDYFNHNLSTGGIPTEEMAVSTLTKALADNATAPGGETFFASIGDKEVTLYGRQMKVRDLVGPEVLQSYQVKAAETQFKNNRVLQQQFTFGIQDATAQVDPHVGLASLGRMQTELYKRQDTDAVTTQSQALDAARGTLLNRIKADSTQRLETMDLDIKADNRMALFDHKYSMRMAGNPVSTNWRTFETSEDTGKFTKEDGANYAINKMDEIDRMSLAPADKDALKLQYLKADEIDGPFRVHFQTLTGDAVSQLAGLVIAEGVELTPENTAKITEFRRMYQTDPATVGALYPVAAAMAERMELMDRSGIGLASVIDAERQSKDLTKEEKQLQDVQWRNLFSESTSAVAYLPVPLQRGARTLFESELYRTGDERTAKNAVDEWLEKTAVSFGSSTKTVGAIQKRTLMVDPQDPNSWSKGQEIINRTIRKIAETKPWVNAGDITITETPNGIRLNDLSSSINMPLITTEMLQREYQIEQAEIQRTQAIATEQAADAKIGEYRDAQDDRAKDLERLQIPGGKPLY